MAETNLDTEIQILTRAADIGIAALNSKIDKIDEEGEIVSESTFVGPTREAIMQIVYDSIAKIYYKHEIV